MEIRRKSDGKIAVGPDGPVPEGFERVEAKDAPTSLMGRIMERQTSGQGIKDIVNFPVRGFRLAAGLDQPKTLDDFVIMSMMMSPAIMSGGALAGGAAAAAPSMIRAAAPALGRVATSAGIGAGQAAVQGKGDVGMR